MRSFGSDNHSGIHPSILEAISKANVDHDLSYGDDKYTQIAKQKFCELFGDVEVFFTFNGTGANVTSLGSAIKSHNSIICTESAHINVDECGAPEKLTGSKLIAISTPDGKLTPELIKPKLTGFGFCHHSQPKIISITQTTELGTLYSLSEIKAIADLAHSYDMYLHVDGARFSNSIAALGCTAKDFAATGVDVLSFGGTKNGLMLGEAVVFFNKNMCGDFQYIRKQSMQLYSKMRFISAQFIAYLEDNLWLKLATQANDMAVYLFEQLKDIECITITQQPAANAIFLILPKDKKEIIRDQYFFYDWDEATGEIRFMTSFDTTKDDIDSLIAFIRSQCN